MAVHTESFNQADSSTLGPDLTWTEVSGDAETVFNQLRLTAASVSGGTATLLRAEHDVGSSDMFAETDIIAFGNSGTRTGAVVARMHTSALTFYMGRLVWTDALGYHYQVHSCVNGSFVSLAGDVDAGGTPSFPLKIRLECEGDQITLKADGVTVIGPLTNTAVTSNTRGGYRLVETSAAASSIFDNFRTGALADESVIIPTPSMLNVVLMPGQPG